MNDATANAIATVNEAIAVWRAASAQFEATEAVLEGGELISFLREQSVLEPAAVRRKAVRELLTTMSSREVAKELGLSPSRVLQIRNGG